MYKQVEFTREALYRMVWERPVLVIAREIGVSDVALAKACRKAGIPLPNRGHWAIVKTGRVIKIPPLPTPAADQSPLVYFTVLENPPPKAPKVATFVGPPIEIPAELTKPHRLVNDLKAAAKGPARRQRSTSSELRESAAGPDLGRPTTTGTDFDGHLDQAVRGERL